jgi:hypothetical protein
MNTRSFLAALAAALLLPSNLLRAQTAAAPDAPPRKPGEAVTVGKMSFKGDVKAGAEVTAVVSFSIDPGYHVQANPPSEPIYIPAVLKLEPVAGVVVSGPTKYPAGKEFPIAGLPKPLKVYEESFEISVALKIAANAKLPLTIPGVLTYQACRGSTCFPPRKVKVEIPIGK